MLPFGWSIGDLITGTTTLIQCFKALRETGGASSKYEETTAFLENTGLTLARAKEYADDHPNGKYTAHIALQVSSIKKSWENLEKFLVQFKKTLGNSTDQSDFRNGVHKVLKTFKWTLKDLAGEVTKLQDAAAQPLSCLNSLLLLQVL
jgi:hypothetical protein